MSKNVSLDYIDNYNISNIQHSLEKAFFNLDIVKNFKPKMKVLIKPCMPYAVSPDLAESTHPAVIRGLVNVLTDLGVKCVVADSPYKKYSNEALDQAYLNTGMLEVANLTTCELVRSLKTCKIKTPNGVLNKSLTLIDIVNDVDAIINVGKVKVDDKLGYLGVVSNLFGLIPGELKTFELNRLNTVKDFNNYLLDIYQALENKIVLNVIDGIVSQESNKSPRMLYCLGVCENCFSLDASLLEILGYKHENSILVQAEERGLFNLQKPYKQVGEKIELYKLEDFAINNITNDSLIHKNKNEQNKFYKNNQARPNIQPNKCKGCTICSKICPTKAISMKYDKNGELYAEIDKSKCILCYKCKTSCPYSVVEKVVPSSYRNLYKEITKYNEN